MTATQIVRYAVVGLGHIAQVAMIPAFAHARRNSKLVAIVSGDRAKRREIAKRYRGTHAFGYDEYDECLRLVDAVYIALHQRPAASGLRRLTTDRGIRGGNAPSPGAPSAWDGFRPLRGRRPWRLRASVGT